MNILIADDHNLILEGFTRFIKIKFDDAKVYQAYNVQELNSVLAEHSIDILFQDIKFGKDDARDFIAQVKKQYPLLKLIIISTLADPYIVENLFKKGIDGYILKSDENNQIEEAIKAINRNETFVSIGIKNNMPTHKLKQATKTELTPRELEILRLILDEHTMKDIAATLFLSEKTIENHRANIMAKLQVKNTAGLVKKAILEGLV